MNETVETEKLPRLCTPWSHKHGSGCSSRSAWLCPYIVNSDTTLRLSATSQALLRMGQIIPEYCLPGSRAITPSRHLDRLTPVCASHVLITFRPQRSGFIFFLKIRKNQEDFLIPQWFFSPSYKIILGLPNSQLFPNLDVRQLTS